MERARGKAERILFLLTFIRENDGMYNSKELSKLLDLEQRNILLDLQLASKYKFVESRIIKGKERKYFYLG